MGDVDHQLACLECWLIGPPRGRRTRKVVPSLADEVTAIEPPCERAICRTMKSPSPSPCVRDGWTVRPLRKASKMNGSVAGGMGAP